MPLANPGSFAIESAFSMENEMYITSDLCLVVTLSLFLPIADVDFSNPKKVKYLFQNTDECQDLIHKFITKELLVDPSAFYLQLKTIKSTLYEIKSANR